MNRRIDKFLKSLLVEGTSDIHLKVGRPPWRRIHGVLQPVDGKPFTYDELEDLAKRFFRRDEWEKFDEKMEYETSYEIPDLARFRISIFKQRGAISMAIRIVPFKIPALEALRVPPVMEKVALSLKGLVLVTGVTGSGKSSTLASIIDYINNNRKCHIITIEDPIEFIHEDKKALVNQREIGIDTKGFSTAFRSALRQDPDIILVGELRDAETMEIALRAADTGHLVLSTLHAADTKEAVGRFIDVFPPGQQRQVRIQLAANLNAVISQRLVNRADGNGRVLAAEVMIVNAAIREYILDPGSSGDILQNMEKGREQYGSQTFDQALLDLYHENLINLDEAVKNATSPNDIKLKIDLDFKK